jgi:DNA-binding beta-propeller fold protein YncE
MRSAAYTEARLMRSRRLLHLGFVGLAICALTNGCRGSRSSPAEPPEIHGNSLALIDAKSNAVVADVAVARYPTRIAYGGGAFWVVSPDSGIVVRVTVATKAVTRFHIGKAPYDVAIGAGALWVPDHDGQRLLRFDLESHALRETRDLGMPAISVGFGFGSVWLVVANGTVLRIDPRTLHVTRSIPDATTAIEGSEPKLAFGRSSVWISSPAESTVARIDPVRGTLHMRTLLGATGVSAGAGAVWVADNATAIWRFDGGRPQRIHVGMQPQDVAATSESVWVADYGDRTLVRLDPTSRRVLTRLKLRRQPVAVAAGGGLVAVAMLEPPP